MTGLEAHSIQRLLQRHAAIGNELLRRNVCRTSNNPLGDVAEYLFHKSFGWRLERNSKAGFDAVSDENVRIQIKSRRVSQRNKSLQAGDIRKLDEKLFDALAGIVFGEDYEVKYAMLIPHQLILDTALKIEHSNSFRIYLKPDWLEKDGVFDLTKEVQATWKRLNQPND